MFVIECPCQNWLGICLENSEEDWGWSLDQWDPRGHKEPGVRHSAQSEHCAGWEEASRGGDGCRSILSGPTVDRVCVWLENADVQLNELQYGFE